MVGLKKELSRRNQQEVGRWGGGSPPLDPSRQGLSGSQDGSGLICRVNRWVWTQSLGFQSALSVIKQMFLPSPVSYRFTREKVLITETTAKLPTISMCVLFIIFPPLHSK